MTPIRGTSFRTGAQSILAQNAKIPQKKRISPQFGRTFRFGKMSRYRSTSNNKISQTPPYQVSKPVVEIDAHTRTEKQVIQISSSSVSIECGLGDQHLILASEYEQVISPKSDARLSKMQLHTNLSIYIELAK